MAKLRVDLGELKRKGPNIGETRELARISGMPVGAFTHIDLDTLPLDAVIAMVVVIQRRANPNFKVSDLDSMEWEDLEIVDTYEPDPTPAPPIKKLRSGAAKS